MARCSAASAAAARLTAYDTGVGTGAMLDVAMTGLRRGQHAQDVSELHMSLQRCAICPRCEQ
jgi:hypothetical protein